MLKKITTYIIFLSILFLSGCYTTQRDHKKFYHNNSDELSRLIVSLLPYKKALNNFKGFGYSRKLEYIGGHESFPIIEREITYTMDGIRIWISEDQFSGHFSDVQSLYQIDDILEKNNINYMGYNDLRFDLIIRENGENYNFLYYFHPTEEFEDELRGFKRVHIEGSWYADVVIPSGDPF